MCFVLSWGFDNYLVMKWKAPERIEIIVEDKFAALAKMRLNTDPFHFSQ